MNGRIEIEVRLSSFLHRHTLTQLGRMNERENSCWRSSFMSLGFTAAIGAHYISEEVAGFLDLWFPQGKFFVSRLL